MRVTVDGIEIKDLASQLEQYAEEFTNEIKKIRNTVDNISLAWDGEDAIKYVNILQEKYILGLEELREIIDEYKVYLNNIPEAYEILDNVYSSKHIEV